VAVMEPRSTGCIQCKFVSGIGLSMHVLADLHILNVCDNLMIACLQCSVLAYTSVIILFCAVIFATTKFSERRRDLTRERRRQNPANSRRL